MKIKFESKLTKENTSEEDSGSARIAEFSLRLPELREEDKGIWVKVISWDLDKEHEEFKQLLKAKKVRITIETIK